MYKVKISVDENNLIRDVVVMEDFFTYPEDVIWEVENRLKETHLSNSDIVEKAISVLGERNAILAGCTSEEFIRVFTEVRPIE